MIQQIRNYSRNNDLKPMVSTLTPLPLTLTFPSRPMSFISRTCYVIGSLLLLNAGYASYSFNQVAKRVLDHNLELPLDIKVEALVACAVFTLGAILGIEATDQVDIYSGQLVKPRDQSGLKSIFMGEATGEQEMVGTTPFDHIESNVEFINIIKRREEFAKWEQSIHS